MIGIINIGSMNTAPYLKKYLKVFDENNIEYDIIHWIREEEKDYKGKNVYTYREPLKRYSGLAAKFLPFMHFRKYVKGILKKNKYDKLIIFTTQTAFFLGDILIRKYKNKYFFDYRDTSYEYVKLYGKYVNSIIKNSRYTMISSPGFREYLTKDKDYIIAHNFQTDYLKRRRTVCNKKLDGEKIVIGYIGVLRECDYHKKLIDYFGNDKRFEFNIHGMGDDYEELSRYSSDFDNVHVFGAYDECNKYDIIETFDIICYNYPYSFVNYPALANKFYDGIVLKKPLFGNSRTFSGQLVMEKGVGISCDENSESIADEVYEYYHSFDADKFVENCDKCLDDIIKCDDKVYSTIKEFAIEK